MSKLNKIFESLQNRINSGEVTLEAANIVLEKAKAKYPDEEVGELTEKAVTESTEETTEEETVTESAEDEEITLEQAMASIEALLNEAEDKSLKCGGECCSGTATTSKDAPDLPEKTNTGEQVTNAIDANDTSSEKKMEALAKNNEQNAKADADGEEDKDTTAAADSVIEKVNDLKLRAFEAHKCGQIDSETLDTFLEFLDLDSYTFIDEEPVTEGFNNDVNEMYRKSTKEIKEILKKVGTSTKHKDYVSAKKALDMLDEKIDKLIKDIEDYEGTVPDAVFGYLFRSFIGFLKIFALALITLPIGGVGAVVGAIEHGATDVFGVASKLYDKIKDKKDISPDDFNVFKNAIIIKCKAYKSHVNNLRKQVEQAEEKEAEKATKESEEIVDAYADTVLEAYNEGFLDDEEAIEMLMNE